MPPADSADRVRIRRAEQQDAPALASLSTELGYPSSPEAASRRLSALGDSAQHAVYVAVRAERVLGWAHVCRVRCVESDEFAEIAGLVVAVSARGAGIGRTLVAACEAWARHCGLRRIRVRSRVARKQAHQFYEGLGFARSKEQAVFDKGLEDDAGTASVPRRERLDD